MANKIQKQKGVLVTLGIVEILIGILFVIFGIILVVHGIQGVTKDSNPNLVMDIIRIVGGAVMTLFGCSCTLYGGRTLWISLAVRATKGSIAETNIGKGTVNGKKCPKCGCTNTPDSTKCTSCGADLD